MMATMDGPGSAGRRSTPRLTPAELDVLRASAAGMGTADVADHLALAPEAVRAHVASAMAKLGARSKLEAVVVAFTVGLLDAGAP